MYADARALERDFGFVTKITLRERPRRFAEYIKSIKVDVSFVKTPWPTGPFAEKALLSRSGYSFKTAMSLM